jgi:hypothetical protein
MRRPWLTKTGVSLKILPIPPILKAMPEPITLYHGSIYEFDRIDVSRGKPFKDFGIGFYTSKDREHAARMALRNKRIAIERKRRTNDAGAVTAWLYIYRFDLQNLNMFKVKEFKEADADWMRFVIQNRMNEARQHDFDIVIGPTANDNTRASIDTVFSASGGNIMSDRAINALLQLVEPENLPSQYFFGAQKAADGLLLERRLALE